MEGLRDRTKAFALRVIKLYASLPKTTMSDVFGKQLLRAGTSVAANFREASRARSNAEFIAKLGTVEQELDETMLWLEFLVEADIVPQQKLASLQGEAEELLKIIVATIKRSRTSKKHPKSTSRPLSQRSAFRSQLSALFQIPTKPRI
jgi:four helix bundle protein